MATKKPRLNVTLDFPEEKLLATLAKKEHKSISFLMRELILEALERREDLALSDLAATRLTKSKEKISHEDAWKEVLRKVS